MEGIAISKICINFAVAIEKGSVAQLNRASDYGSEGYRFESCRDHKYTDGPVAQMNRAFDYGSKGYRFESCRGHKEVLFMAPFLFFQCIFAKFVSKSILYGKK